MKQARVRQWVQQGFWLLAYAISTALPLGGAGLLFARYMPKDLPAQTPFVPSWFGMAIMTSFLIFCGIISFVLRRCASLRAQDIGNSLYVSSMIAGSLFVAAPILISAIWLLPFD
jgi:uncharacterized membrane protein YhdT